MATEGALSNFLDDVNTRTHDLQGFFGSTVNITYERWIKIFL